MGHPNPVMGPAPSSASPDHLSPPRSNLLMALFPPPALVLFPPWRWPCSRSRRWSCSRSRRWPCSRSRRWSCSRPRRWSCSRPRRWSCSRSRRWSCSRSRRWSCSRSKRSASDPIPLSFRTSSHAGARTLSSSTRVPFPSRFLTISCSKFTRWSQAIS